MTSPVINHDIYAERRRSVLPTNNSTILPPTSTNLYADCISIEDTTGSSLLRKASFAASNFRRMSKAFRDEGPTKGFLRAAIGDPNRPKYMQLAAENDELYSEWKRLKGFVQSFDEEYKASKEAVILDPYRRYKRLCAMVKKLVLHLRLNDPSPRMTIEGRSRGGSLRNAPGFSCGQVLQSSVKERELKQKHSNMCDSLTTEQLARKMEELRERNSELQSQIDSIIDNINELSDSYELSKRSSPISRYYHLKKAVKSFLASNSTDL
ncbi:hypothetical protein Aperf_G00000110280 [Anoplocephala perfoliata]